MVADAWISSPFLVINLQLHPPVLYLSEKINVLTRVQFYCIKLGEILFHSVLLEGLQEQQNLLHGYQEYVSPSRRCSSSLVSPVVTGTFPFARKFARTSSLEIKRLISKFHLQSAI